MPFIGAAVVGAIGLAGTTAGAIVGGLINVGVAGGLAYASSALGGEKAGKVQTSVRTDVEMGGGQPRGSLYGRCGTAGYLAYFNTFLENNNMADLVYVIGDGPHDGLEVVWVNGERRAVRQIAGNAYRTGYEVVGVGVGGASYLHITLYHGYPPRLNPGDVRLGQRRRHHRQGRQGAGRCRYSQQFALRRNRHGPDRAHRNKQRGHCSADRT
ncbi:hypothetical protein ACT6QG_04515 [Xanthobacter sp. TB0136]|uniref:hypothetical protein n=1 Tax=Xanthobacter sp. TB0136 TaxID=3459177 RepID=UPI00403A48BD